MSAPRTLFDKVWDRHAVRTEGDGQTLLYVTRHILYDSSFHAFELLRRSGRSVRRPAQTFATADHSVPTAPGRARDHGSPLATLLAENTARAGIAHFGLGDPRQGIVHVIAPELGLAQPGTVIACADSHVSTLGALGAVALGVGHTESYHVLATQTLWLARPRSMRIRIEGARPFGVAAKDMILQVVARLGAGGAGGHAVEFAGACVRALSMEERMTVCNMAVEAGARAAIMAPDATTFSYLAGRAYAPAGRAWERALGWWQRLATDPNARFDAEDQVSAADLAPMVTWGTSPADALPVTARVPDPATEPSRMRRAAMERSLAYMDLSPGAAIDGLAVDRVFIGSCTNARLEDLRAAAEVARRGRARVPTLVVPGSTRVKREAEAEGLDRVFHDAGFEWREAGCSMCVGMNGDVGRPGERCASTSNRNYADRQGRGVRTHLMSPAMAAAAAISGRIVDVRRLATGGGA